MKSKIVLGLMALSIVAMSFKIAVDKSSAIVEEQSGVKIFCFSKPVNKFDILGTVKVTGMVKNEKGGHMVGLLVENAKKDYPSGEGIIVNSEFNKADVIKFKD